MKDFIKKSFKKSFREGIKFFIIFFLIIFSFLWFYMGSSNLGETELPFSPFMIAIILSFLIGFIFYILIAIITFLADISKKTK